MCIFDECDHAVGERKASTARNGLGVEFVFNGSIVGQRMVSFAAVGTLGGGVTWTGAIVAQIRARDNPLVG